MGMQCKGSYIVDGGKSTAVRALLLLNAILATFTRHCKSNVTSVRSQSCNTGDSQFLCLKKLMPRGRSQRNHSRMAVWYVNHS